MTAAVAAPEASKLSYSLKEVHEMTGLPKGWLYEECRAGRLKHIRTPNDRFIGMTRRQIDEMLDGLTRQASADVESSVEAQAIERTKARVARRQAA